MSIKSLGKIAAIAAVAGLGLTACADDAATQAREQEETCGLLQASAAKANDAVSNVREATGPDSRAAFAVESAALDLRQHSFDRSDDLQTAIQVQAAQFHDMAETLDDDVSGLSNSEAADVKVDGMGLKEASEVLNTYCSPVFAQQGAL
ncbi:MAG TPA: hypothetical protein VIG67_04875 [Yaniella sp.]